MGTLIWFTSVLVCGICGYYIGKAVQRAEGAHLVNFLAILVRVSNILTPPLELIDLKREWLRKSKEKINAGADVYGLGLWFTSDFGLLTNLVNRFIDNNVDRVVRDLIESLQSDDLGYNQGEEKLDELHEILDKLSRNLDYYENGLTWPILKARVYSHCLEVVEEIEDEPEKAKTEA